MITQVTASNLDEMYAQYLSARGGETNEETDSEAVFMLSARFFGAYTLHNGFCSPVWIGLQNATARITDHGEPFGSVIEALEWAVKTHPVSVYYSDDSVERLHWLADRVRDFKAENRTILISGA